MKFFIIYIIKFYRFFISPMTGPTCRFYPTCSSYMAEAVEKRGVIKGISLGIKRLLKCHPFYKGDFIDPVPDATNNLSSKPIATVKNIGYKPK